MLELTAWLGFVRPTVRRSSVSCSAARLAAQLPPIGPDEDSASLGTPSTFQIETFERTANRGVQDEDALSRDLPPDRAPRRSLHPGPERQEARVSPARDRIS